MKLNAKDVIIPTLVLFLVSLLVTAALAGTNLLTKDQIKVQNELAAQASRKVVLPTAETFEEAPDKSYYIGKDAGGQTVGYVFSTQSNAGYGGAVGVMTGIASDGNVTGVVILSHNETPGLGANAEKESFRNQYLQQATANGFTVVKSGTPGDGEILAMTGATITSNAVTEAVNKAEEQFQSVKEGA